jgi:hypothetical protein
MNELQCFILSRIVNLYEIDMNTFFKFIRCGAINHGFSRILFFNAVPDFTQTISEYQQLADSIFLFFKV